MGACCSNPVTKALESSKDPEQIPFNCKRNAISPPPHPSDNFALYDEIPHPKYIHITRELLRETGYSPRAAKLIIDFWWEPVLGFAIEKIKPDPRGKDISVNMMETFFVNLDESDSTDGVERCFAYKGPMRELSTDETAYDLFLMPQRYCRLVDLAGEVLAHASKNVVNKGLPIIITESTADIIPFVIAYLQHHNNIEPAAIPKPLRSIHMVDNCEDKWDALFIDSLRKKLLIQLITTANTIGINSLLHLASAKVATFIKGQSPDRIKEILRDDF